MVKTYDHAVIYNGVFYPANTPIDVEEEKAETADEKAGKANDNSKRGRKPKSTDTGE
jgi:hypothetical protein